MEIREYIADVWESMKYYVGLWRPSIIEVNTLQSKDLTVDIVLDQLNKVANGINSFSKELDDNKIVELEKSTVNNYLLELINSEDSYFITAVRQRIRLGLNTTHDIIGWGTYCMHIHREDMKDILIGNRTILESRYRLKEEITTMVELYNKAKGEKIK